MKKFKLWQDNHADDLSENFLAKLKHSSNKSVRKLSKSASKLGPGKSSFVTISIPLDLAEAKEQVGKKGGELAEYQFLLSLYDNLASMDVDVTLKDSGKEYTRAAFEAGPFAKNLEEYRKQERNTKKKAESKWISHGEKGADHVFTRLLENVEAIQLYDFTLEATGVKLTGKEKSDVKIHYKKKSVKELEKIIKLSLKTSEDASPMSEGGFHEGFQTSWKHYIFSLITGMGANDIKKTEMSEERVAGQIRKSGKRMETALKKSKKAETKETEFRDSLDLAEKDYASLIQEYNMYRELNKLFDDVDALDKYEPTDDQIQWALNNAPKALKKVEQKADKARKKIEVAKSKYYEGYQKHLESIEGYESAVSEFNEAKKGYENTVDAKLSRLGEEVGMSTDLATEINKYNDAFKKYKGMSKTVRVEEAGDWIKGQRVEFFEIVKYVLDQKMTNKKVEQQVIQSIMKLSGVESSLDYLTMGASKVTKVKKRNTKFISREEQSFLASRAASTLFNHNYHKIIDDLVKEDLRAESAVVGDRLEFSIFRSSMNKPYLKIELKVGFNNGRVGLPTFLDEETGDFKKLTSVFASENNADVQRLERELEKADAEIARQAKKDKETVKIMKKQAKSGDGVLPGV